MYSKSYYRRSAVQKALAMLLVLLFSASTAMPAYADPVQDAQQWQDLIDANDQRVNELNSEKSDLQKEYDDLQVRVDELQAAVDEFDVQIEGLELQLEIANQELDDKYTVYCSRVREIEEKGKTSYWSIIFKASSLKDLLGRIDYIEEIMSYDESALTEIEGEISKLDKQAEKLNSFRADRNYTERQLRMTQNKLLDKINARIAEISSLVSQNLQY